MTTLKSIDSPSSVPGADPDTQSKIVALNPEALSRLTKSVGPILASIVGVALAGLLSLQISPTLEKTIGTAFIVVVAVCAVIYVRQKNLQ